MAAVRTTGERLRQPRRHRRACSSITLIFLAPIYWITSTAFKPRNLATTVPPTVFFSPRSRPSSSCSPSAPAAQAADARGDYAAAPWWERLVFDGGEKVVRVGQGRGAARRAIPTAS